MKMKWYTVAAAIGAVAILASCNAAASIPTTLQVTQGNVTNIIYNNGSYTYPSQAVGVNTFSASFTIKNTSSTTAYSVTAITSSNNPPCAVGGTTSGSLNPGGTLTFLIENTGSTLSAGTYSTTVSITNNAPDTTPYFKFAFNVTLK